LNGGNLLDDDLSATRIFHRDISHPEVAVVVMTWLQFRWMQCHVGTCSHRHRGT